MRPWGHDIETMLEAAAKQREKLLAKVTTRPADERLLARVEEAGRVTPQLETFGDATPDAFSVKVPGTEETPGGG